MSTPYNEQLTTARRWDKTVDFGSPMSAWTPEMLAEHSKKHQRDNTMTETTDIYDEYNNVVELLEWVEDDKGCSRYTNESGDESVWVCNECESVIANPIEHECFE